MRFILYYILANNIKEESKDKNSIIFPVFLTILYSGLIKWPPINIIDDNSGSILQAFYYSDHLSYIYLLIISNINIQELYYLYLEYHIFIYSLYLRIYYIISNSIIIYLLYVVYFYLN